LDSMKCLGSVPLRIVVSTCFHPSRGKFVWWQVWQDEPTENPPNLVWVFLSTLHEPKYLGFYMWKSWLEQSCVRVGPQDLGEDICAIMCAMVWFWVIHILCTSRTKWTLWGLTHAWLIIVLWFDIGIPPFTAILTSQGSCR
jgi:hypothetical protein